MRMEAMEEKSSTLLVKDARIFVTVVMQEGHWTKVGCRGDCRILVGNDEADGCDRRLKGCGRGRVLILHLEMGKQHFGENILDSHVVLWIASLYTITHY